MGRVPLVWLRRFMRCEHKLDFFSYAKNTEKISSSNNLFINAHGLQTNDAAGRSFLS